MKRVLQTALMVVWATSASAQVLTPANTKVLGTIDRVKGTFTSTSIDIPRNVDGLTQVVVQLNIPTAEYEDVTNSARYWISYFDGARGWLPIGPGTLWTGGRFIARDGTINPPPGEYFVPGNIDQVAGKTIRVDLDIPRAMKVGVSVIVQ